MSNGRYAETAAYAEPSSSRNAKKKKQGFIKRWFNKMAKESWEEARDETIPQLVEKSVDSGLGDRNKFLRFTVYPAQGGRVVEVLKKTNSNNGNRISSSDEYGTSLYVITHEQDFGREIDKIITMEALR